MEPIAAAPFSAWETFYVIVGSSAAALTGLQFVVIALGADRNAPRGETEVNAFGTPTVVHFCAVLLIAAVLSAPWHGIAGVAWSLRLAGLAGIVYTLIVVRRARRARLYTPVFEDWLWHTVLPFIAYAALLGAAVGIREAGGVSLFVVAGAALVLLFAGIHNAWDAAMYMTISAAARDRDAKS